MGDYYLINPKCKQCDLIQTEHTYVKDDECGDGYFVCERCGAEHIVHAHMEFDVKIKES